MKPKAVLISDVHYNLSMLRLADEAMVMAISKANSLNVPLIVTGDLHDTKANLRGECVEAMIATFKLCEKKPYVIVGNHCKINEKSEKHSLVFLEPYANIISKPTLWEASKLVMLPYFSDTAELRKYLQDVTPGTTILMHQGLKKANAGEYAHDKTALDPMDVCKFRVISGHYHTRQTFNYTYGQFDFVGNPYTLTWAEAADPEKGYQILNSDNSLTFVPTNLRKHVKIQYKVGYTPHVTVGAEDLVWVRLEGTKEQLAEYTKEQVGKDLGLAGSFKFDTLVINKKALDINIAQSKSPEAMLDAMIDDLGALSLKDLWREVVADEA